MCVWAIALLAANPSGSATGALTREEMDSGNSHVEMGGHVSVWHVENGGVHHLDVRVASQQGSGAVMAKALAKWESQMLRPRRADSK